MSVNSARQDELQREVSKRETLLRLFRYMLAYKKELMIAVVLILITLLITLAAPLMIERAVDVHVAGKDVQGLFRLSVAAFVLFLIYWLGTRKSLLIMADVTNRVLLTIRQELYTHVQSLSFHFFDTRPTGKILARIIGDVNSLKDVLPMQNQDCVSTNNDLPTFLKHSWSVESLHVATAADNELLVYSKNMYQIMKLHLLTDTFSGIKVQFQSY